MKDKEQEADKLMRKAQKLLQPSVLSLRIKPDRERALPLFEQAVNLFKQCDATDKARVASERAAECQNAAGSGWHAAKHLETAAALALEMGDSEGAIRLYSEAADLYFGVGRLPAGAMALCNGGKALQQQNPGQASALFNKALDTITQNDERGTSAPDIFRQVIGHELKQENWEEAAGLLLKFGAFCEEKKMAASQNRCYLGAVVVWLHAMDGRQAWLTFQDCISIASFANSEEGRAADRLIDAYRNDSADEIKQVIKKNACFQFLETPVGRLAVKLPNGDVGPVAKGLGSAEGGSAEEDLEDPDLT
ncbi:hypothetical protein BSKO_10754 [Bryopsis sp. KO-2023]|nr:hypothetical protein BSKO_10754 [Bryopsis sp. KO-2023]